MCGGGLSKFDGVGDQEVCCNESESRVMREHLRGKCKDTHLQDAADRVTLSVSR